MKSPSLLRKCNSNALQEVLQVSVIEAVKLVKAIFSRLWSTLFLLNVFTALKGSNLYIFIRKHGNVYLLLKFCRTQIHNYKHTYICDRNWVSARPIIALSHNGNVFVHDGRTCIKMTSLKDCPSSLTP